MQNKNDSLNKKSHVKCVIEEKLCIIIFAKKENTMLILIKLVIWKCNCIISSMISWFEPDDNWHCYFTDHKPVKTHSGHDCSARHLVAVIKRGNDGAEGAAEHPVPPTCPLVNKKWHDGHVHQVGHSQVSHIHIWYCLFGGPGKSKQQQQKKLLVICGPLVRYC